MTLAPKSSTAPDIPFQSFQPNLVSTWMRSSTPTSHDSALGVLALVAREMDRPTTSGSDYFLDANQLPTDLADSLVHL
jgi:hypothetical protein